MGISGIGAIFDASVISFFFSNEERLLCRQQGAGEMRVTYIFVLLFWLRTRRASMFLCVSLSQFCLVSFFGFLRVVDFESFGYNFDVVLLQHVV